MDSAITTPRSPAGEEPSTSPHTHVTESNGGALIAESSYADVDRFAAPLRCFNGNDPFALTLWPLPAGTDYDQARAAGTDALEFIQAAGRADALTVELRKAGGSQWGADWALHVVGRPHSAPAALDVPIDCRTAPKWSLPHEVSGKDPAGNLFHTPTTSAVTFPPDTPCVRSSPTPATAGTSIFARRRDRTNS